MAHFKHPTVVVLGDYIMMVGGEGWYNNGKNAVLYKPRDNTFRTYHDVFPTSVSGHAGVVSTIPWCMLGVKDEEESDNEDGRDSEDGDDSVEDKDTEEADN